MSERRFPIQVRSGQAVTIPWSLAEEAYLAYVQEYGSSQSLERLAERGGFGASEMDLYRPGWRPVAQELDQLRAQLAKAKADNKVLTEALKFYADRDTYGKDHFPWCPLTEDMDDDHDPGHRARMAIALVNG